MKKVIFFLSLLSCSLITLFGQNNSLDGYYPFQEDSFLSSMTIKDNQIIIKYENPPIDKEDEVYIFEVKHVYGMPFIKLDRNLPPEVSEWYSFEEYNSIQTSNMILFLSFKGKDNHIFAFTKGYPFTRAPLTFTRCTEWISQYLDCSSYLTEKNKTYSVKNLGSLVVDTPWVEGVKGDGIGEWIEFTLTKNAIGPFATNGLRCFGGSKDYENMQFDKGNYDYPDYSIYNKTGALDGTWKANNRIESMTLSNSAGKKISTLYFANTFPELYNAKYTWLAINSIVNPMVLGKGTYRMTIESVYKGEKWDDTVLGEVWFIPINNLAAKIILQDTFFSTPLNNFIKKCLSVYHFVE